MADKSAKSGTLAYSLHLGSIWLNNNLNYSKSGVKNDAFYLIKKNEKKILAKMAEQGVGK